MNATNTNSALKEALKKYSKVMDRMYWIFLVAILLYELLGSTYFLQNFVVWFAGLFKGGSPEFVAMLYQSIVNLRLLIIIPAVYNILVEAETRREQVILSGMLLVGWIYAILMREQNDTYIFRDMAMIVASYGKDYKKIAHVSMWLAGIVMLLTVSSYFLGILPERTLEQDGMVRHSFGTLGPTNLAGHLFFPFF